MRKKLPIYAEWSKKAANNARSIAEEAEILLKHEKNERAYYLSHMANEESVKAIILAACCIDEIPDDQKEKVSKLIRNHKKKIECFVGIIESWLSEGTPPGLEYLSSQLKELKNEYIDFLNDQKNDTMYVSLKNDNIYTPKDAIKGKKIKTFVTVARHIARIAHQHALQTMQ